MAQSKKILSILLILCMVVSCISVVFATAGTAEISLETPSAKPKKGESFEVTVSLSNNPGFAAMDLCIGYNQDQLQCTNIEAGKVISSSLYAVNPAANAGAKISAASANAISKNGAIATLTFKALKDVTDYGFKLTASNFYTASSEKIEIIATGFGSASGESGSGSEGSNTGSGSSGAQGQTSGGTVLGQTENKSEAVIEETYTFSDTAGTWCEQYVSGAVKNKILTGYSDGTFRPKNNITRAQFVTILYRMAGSPDVDINTNFTDISGLRTEFQKAISWAKSKGYVDGKTATTFNPNGYLTREQAVKILFQYSGGQSGSEIMFTSIYDSVYTDMGKVASWAKQGMYWSIYNKVIQGTSATTLNPKGNITRGAAAKILTTYLSLNK